MESIISLFLDFPSIYKKEGFFQDNDRELLKQKGFYANLYESQFAL